MPQQRLYYEYVDGELIPYWYVLSFQSFEVNWDKPIFYFDAIKPFEYIDRDEFDDSKVSMSISLSDLVFNYESPGRIGIRIAVIKKRLEVHKVDPYVVNQFIISVPEVNELLEMLPAEREMTLMVS
jgi:hypothetical protein